MNSEKKTDYGWIGREAIILTILFLILYFGLGYIQGGTVGGFSLLSYGILLSLIGLLAMIPFGGIYIFYSLAGKIPHFYTAYSMYHIVFLIEVIFAWIYFVVFTAIIIFLIITFVWG